MTEITKIIIPTAGWATRMRPQTWSKPKPLVSVAGRTVLDHLLSTFHSLPGSATAEYVFICSPGLGESQLPPYLQAHHPHLRASFVLQPTMKGQSDALYLARHHLTGPLLICFSDTLIDTDFSFLNLEDPQGVAFVKSVPDPRRFGVAEVSPQGFVTRLVEKPTSLENTLVVVGCYYLRSGQDLLTAIDTQVARGLTHKGEYFLTDTINIMIEQGLQMRTATVSAWLDTGTIPATLETNRYLLQHAAPKTTYAPPPGVTIHPPVSIHASAQITNAVIGPYVSIAEDCTITAASISDSILEAGVTVHNASLHNSFIGRHARVEGRSANDPPLQLNIGDNSTVSQK